MPTLTFLFQTLADMANYLNGADVTVVSVDTNLYTLQVRRCAMAEKLALTKYRASFLKSDN